MPTWGVERVRYDGPDGTAPALARALNRLHDAGATIVQVLPHPMVGYLIVTRRDRVPTPPRRSPRRPTPDPAGQLGLFARETTTGR